MALLGTGYLVARHQLVLSSTWWLGGAAFLALLAAAVRGRTATTLLGVSVIAFGAGWFGLRIWEAPTDSLARSLGAQPRLIDVEGSIASRIQTPVRRGKLAPFVRQNESTTFVLRITRLFGSDGDSSPASGSLRVFVDGQVTSLVPGDLVRVRGLARGAIAPTNPGQPDARYWARQNRSVGTLEVANKSLLLQVEDGGEGWWSKNRRMADRSISALRLRARAWLDHSRQSPLVGQGRALLLALTLGERGAGLSDVSALFQRAGLAHVLAVSGLHLMVVAGMVTILLRFLGVRPLVELVVLGLFVALYMTLVPARAPIVRAGVMVLALLVARAGGRQHDRITMLGWAAVLVLLWRPMELWSMGFQLSFGVVAALMTLATPLRTKLFGEPVDPDSRRFMGWCVDRGKNAIAATLCAWLVATPLVMHHVGIVSPLAIVSVIVVMPMVSVILMLAFGASIVSVLAPESGLMIAGPLTDAASFLVRQVAWLDSLPGSTLYLPSIGAAWSLVTLGIIVAWIGPPIQRTSLGRLRLLATAASALWLTGSLLTVSLPSDQVLRLDTFDVGDGTCHLLRSGSDAILYDCGSLKLAIGERTIPRAVRELGAWRVPRVVITHANLDHYSALLDVVRPLGVREVLLGESFIQDANARPDGASSFVLGELRSLGVNVRVISAGDSLTVGDAALEILSPLAGQVIAEANDASLVSMVRVMTDGGERRLLLTGDIQRDAMGNLRTRFNDLSADVLEVPHHGSAHREAYSFVELVDPAIVVQSTGPSRLNDPRWDGVRDHLKWLSTAGDGAISVMIHRDGSIDSRSWKAGPLPPQQADSGR